MASWSLICKTTVTVFPTALGMRKYLKAEAPPVSLASFLEAGKYIQRAQQAMSLSSATLSGNFVQTKSQTTEPLLLDGS